MNQTRPGRRRGSMIKTLLVEVRSILEIRAVTMNWVQSVIPTNSPRQNHMTGMLRR